MTGKRGSDRNAVTKLVGTFIAVKRHQVRFRSPALPQTCPFPIVRTLHIAGVLILNESVTARLPAKLVVD